MPKLVYKSFEIEPAENGYVLTAFHHTGFKTFIFGDTMAAAVRINALLNGEE